MGAATAVDGSKYKYPHPSNDMKPENKDKL